MLFIKNALYKIEKAVFTMEDEPVRVNELVLYVGNTTQDFYFLRLKTGQIVSLWGKRLNTMKRVA